jgi:hypothetical protein
MAFTWHEYKVCCERTLAAAERQHGLAQRLDAVRDAVVGVAPPPVPLTLEQRLRALLEAFGADPPAAASTHGVLFSVDDLTRLVLSSQPAGAERSPRTHIALMEVDEAVAASPAPPTPAAAAPAPPVAPAGVGWRVVGDDVVPDDDLAPDLFSALGIDDAGLDGLGHSDRQAAEDAHVAAHGLPTAAPGTAAAAPAAPKAPRKHFYAVAWRYGPHAIVAARRHRVTMTPASSWGQSDAVRAHRAAQRRAEIARAARAEAQRLDGDDAAEGGDPNGCYDDDAW